MFFLQRPSAKDIRRFIEQSKDLPLSYRQIGMALLRPSGYRVDEALAPLGVGKRTFGVACSALRTWRHCELGWVEIFPQRTSSDPGAVVAVLVRHLGFWSMNGCRVLYCLDTSSDEYGFAYGTLTNHAESGEEIFKVSLDPDTGMVTYTLRAVSRPQAALARIGYPITRQFQSRFRTESMHAMCRAIAHASS